MVDFVLIVELHCGWGVEQRGQKILLHVPYAAIIAEKTAAKEQIETEIVALSDNISALKDQLKSKKSALKVATKDLSKAEAKKVAAEKKAAEESKKAEAESVLKKLLASGMSADEIIAKLQ